MTFEQAITTLRTHQLAQEQVADAHTLLLNEVIRYRQALRYYAEPKNWLDGSPMLNSFAVNDEGLTARIALRLVDFVGEPLVEVPNTEEGNDGKADAGSSGAAS
jgi:hypothetical protein